MGVVNVCVIAKLSVSESMREFLYNVFEYHCHTTINLQCMIVLVHVRACDPACMRYRSGEVKCV